MHSTQQIVASIERIEASSAAIQALLCKVVESQAQNQQQMMEMLKILANNNSINTASIPSEESAGNSPTTDIPNEQNPSVSTVGDDTEEVDENESSESNAQQEEVDENELSNAQQ
ncbi:hypothetical protein MKW94_013583, partial [Papaver nudicaule]|nr:hypothetical protein [Papaver nudicaule]